MRLLIINPNSTEAMTRSIAAAARAVARPTTEITAKNPVGAPPAIQGPQDAAAAIPLAAALHRAECAAAPPDATIIACFDDPGLWEFKASAAHPVIGVGEAAYHAAALWGRRFSVVTSLSVAIPTIEANIAAHGFAARCAGVHAAGVPVLDFEFDKDNAEATLSAEIARRVAEDGCDSVVLGCAGMADLAGKLSARHGVPVIDGVAAAVGLAEAVAGLSAGLSAVA